MEVKMPRIIENKEINDMRRIIKIMLEHPVSAHHRMWEFIIGSVQQKSVIRGKQNGN
jgi:hypothetical protein